MKYKLQVLMAALNCSDDLYQKSNLNVNTIIANQCDKTSIIKNDKYTMINTETRGVGINRNIALLNANSEYVLFSDDDLYYVDNLEEIVLNEFKMNPKADALLFNIEISGGNSESLRLNRKRKRVHYYNFMNYGTVRLACKLSKIRSNNIWFTTMFGGGAPYGSGEDTTFIADCLKRGLKIYTAPFTICKVDQSSSTWFNGYTNKFYIDKGALIYSVFPKFFFILKFVFAYKLSNNDYSFFKILKLLKVGKKQWKKELSIF